MNSRDYDAYLDMEGMIENAIGELNQALITTKQVRNNVSSPDDMDKTWENINDALIILQELMEGI